MNMLFRITSPQMKMFSLKKKKAFYLLLIGDYICTFKRILKGIFSIFSTSSLATQSFSPEVNTVITFFFGHTARHVGSQLPNQGSNPCPLALEAWSLNHWTTREVPCYHFLMSHSRPLESRGGLCINKHICVLHLPQNFWLFFLDQYG